MRSKTSFFNRTLFKKNILRFWPVWVLYLAFLFFMLPVTLYRETKPAFLSSLYLTGDQMEAMVNVTRFGIRCNFLCIFLLAVILVLLIFSYLYQARSCNMIHALPVSRKELFVTGYLNALLFLIGPQILIFLISLIVCIINRVTCVEYLLYWLIFSAIGSFLFVSLAVFFCMVCGNVIATLVSYVAGNLVWTGLRFLMGLIVSTLCYGMEDVLTWRIPELTGVRDSFLSPVICLLANVDVSGIYDDRGTITGAVVEGMPLMLLYLIPAVLFLILAVILYQKRQLECAGDIVAYTWMNPIFRWVIAFFAGTGLGLIFAGVFFSGDRSFARVMILFSAGMALIFFFLAEMMLKKRFRIFRKRIWIEGVISAGAVMFLIGALEGDLFGIERRIPDVGKVAAAQLKAPTHDLVLTEDSEILELEEAHRSIIDHKKEYEDVYYAVDYASEEPEEDMAWYDIVYYLDDGRTVSRSYLIPVGEAYLQDPEDAAARLAQLLSDPEDYLQSFICKNYEEAHYMEGFIDLVSFDTENHILYTDGRNLGPKEAQLLYEAMVRDIREGNYLCFDPYQNGSDQGKIYYNTLSLTGRIEGDVETIYDELLENAENQGYETTSGALVEETYAGQNHAYNSIYLSFNIYTTCTHTIQALTDLGIIRDASELTTWEEYSFWEEEYGITEYMNEPVKGLG